MTHDTPPKRIWEDRMTDLTREQIEALWAGAAPHKYGNYLHIANLARQLLATMTALAEAQAAQAGVVEQAAKLCDETADEALETSGECTHRALSLWFRGQAKSIRSLADPTGVKLLAELRAERDALADRLENEMADLNAADRRNKRLAAANAALEAKVAGLVEAAEDAEYDLLQWLECSKSLTAAGFNMDGTADVTAKLTAALSHIKRGKTNG